MPEPTSAELFPPGTILAGSYEVIGEPAGGGMGKVYRCRNLASQHVRAVKVIRADRAATPVQKKAMEEFLLREASALRAVRHDAVVACHDVLVDREHDCLVLVMDYVEGPTLKDALDAGTLNRREVAPLCRELLEGLSAIHNAGVVHGDLSPQNIILGGPGRKPKLIDFGLASGPEIGDQTIVGGFKGKLSYASLEQLQTGRPSKASDNYSMALVIIETCTGKPVFHSQTFTGAVAERQQPLRIPAAVSRALRGTVAEMLCPGSQRSPAGASWETVRWGLFLSLAVAVALTLALVWFQLSLEPEFVPAPATIPGLSHAAATRTTVQRAIRAAMPASVDWPQLPPIHRAEIMAAAREQAEYTWQSRESSESCGVPRTPRWVPGEWVRGVAYNWGGMDGPAGFNAKLRAGQRIGSGSRDGATQCAAGIDCSGFILYVWGIRGGHTHYTKTLYMLADSVTIDPFTELKPGDALNADSHVVLFAGYRPDGQPTVYEAAGLPGRVVLNAESTWSRYRQYVPVRRMNVLD